VASTAVIELTQAGSTLRESGDIEIGRSATSACRRNDAVPTRRQRQNHGSSHRLMNTSRILAGSTAAMVNPSGQSACPWPMDRGIDRAGERASSISW
jgi:hypothetical protein